MFPFVLCAFAHVFHLLCLLKFIIQVDFLAVIIEILEISAATLCYLLKALLYCKPINLKFPTGFDLNLDLFVESDCKNLQSKQITLF